MCFNNWGRTCYRREKCMTGLCNGDPKTKFKKSLLFKHVQKVSSCSFWQFVLSMQSCTFVLFQTWKLKKDTWQHCTLSQMVHGQCICARGKWIHNFPHSLRDVISSAITVESLVIFCSDRQDLMTCHLWKGQLYEPAHWEPAPTWELISFLLSLFYMNKKYMLFSRFWVYQRMSNISLEKKCNQQVSRLHPVSISQKHWMWIHVKSTGHSSVYHNNDMAHPNMDKITSWINAFDPKCEVHHE